PAGPPGAAAGHRPARARAGLHLTPGRLLLPRRPGGRVPLLAPLELRDRGLPGPAGIRFRRVLQLLREPAAWPPAHGMLLGSVGGPPPRDGDAPGFARVPCREDGSGRTSPD